MPTPNDPTDLNAPPTDPGAGGTGDHLDYKALYEATQAEIANLKAEDWHKRFTGLQGMYQREKEKWTKEQALLDALKTENDALKSQTLEFETKHKSSLDELSSKASELEIKSAQLERLSTITKKFPSLLEFMGVDEEGNEFDLLPQGTGEELEKALKTFANKMGTKDTKRPQGGSTPKPPSPETQNNGSLWAQAMDALAKGDVKAYDALYQKHLETLT
jgi:hypothetical protein